MAVFYHPPARFSKDKPFPGGIADMDLIARKGKLFVAVLWLFLVTAATGGRRGIRPDCSRISEVVRRHGPASRLAARGLRHHHPFSS